MDLQAKTTTTKAAPSTTGVRSLRDKAAGKKKRQEKTKKNEKTENPQKMNKGKAPDRMAEVCCHGDIVLDIVLNRLLLHLYNPTATSQARQAEAKTAKTEATADR